MNDRLFIDIFAEDRAHEEFVGHLVARLAEEENVPTNIKMRSARGGHGRAIEEFKTYQSLVTKGIAGMTTPDLVVVAIDGNCATFAAKRSEIQGARSEAFAGRIVAACPDPHVERWYLADPDTFHLVVGYRPTIGRKKCERDHYKRMLAEAVRSAEHPVTLGGIDFAPELVERMDLYRAGRNDRSLESFVSDLRGRLRQLSER